MASQRKTIDLSVFQGEARRVRVVIKTPVLGELTTRTNSSNCIITYEAGAILPTVGESYELRWSGGRRLRMLAASTTGQTVTFTGGTGSPLPATGESISIKGFTEPKDIAGWDAECLVRTKAGVVVGTFEVGGAEDTDGGPIVITDASGLIDLVFHETWTAAVDPNFLRYDLLITPDDRRPFFPFGGNLQLQARGNSSPNFDSDSEVTVNLDQDVVIEIAEGLPGESGSGGGGGGSGTVTSFSASPSAIFNVANSTTTPALSLDNQSVNTIFAGPATGAAATPGFRSMVAADVPDLSAAYATVAALAAEAVLARNGDNITSGTVADARIASTIARDTEVTAAISALSTVYQAKDTTLDTYAGIDPAANVQSILAAANYAAIRALLDLEVGTDFYSISAADAAIAAAVAGLYDIKGTTDCSGNPNYPAASKGDAYGVSVAGRIGGASGKVVEVGDVFIAFADNAGGTEASVGTSWIAQQANVPFSANGASLVAAANYAAMLALLGLAPANSPTFAGLTISGASITVAGSTVQVNDSTVLNGGSVAGTNTGDQSLTSLGVSSFWQGILDETTGVASLDLLHAAGSSIASASTINLQTATGDLIHITGSTGPVTAITLGAGDERTAIFDSTPTLTHHATNLNLPSGANIVAAAGDRAVFRGETGGGVTCISYTRADGTPIANLAATVTLTGTQTLTNKIVSLAALPGTDDTYQGTVITGRNAGATIAQWEAVYLASDGEWELADANGTGTYPAVGLAVAAYSATNAATILVHGVARNDAWNWTIGGRVYLSATAGALTQTAPATAGDKVQDIGVALTADSIFVNPSSTFLEIA